MDGAGGGAIWTAASTTNTIDGSKFNSNSGIRGGAIYNNGTLNITNAAEFVSNAATSTSSVGVGGAIYNNIGGVISINGTASNLIKFLGNYTKSQATPTNYGGAIFTKSSSTSNIINYADFEYNGYSDYNASDLAGIDTVSTKDGGAIYVYTDNSYLTIKNSIFKNNAASEQGGAIYNDTGAQLTIANSLFANNAASTKGGAIYTQGALTINSGTEFNQNKAIAVSSAVFGGAIYNYTSGLLAITGTSGSQVKFLGNYTSSSGTSSGGAIYNAGANTLNSISYAVFEYNGYSDYNANDLANVDQVSTKQGGAIYNAGTYLTIVNSTFKNNAASQGGGAIFANTGTLNVQSTADSPTLFSGNKANNVSNAIHLYYNASAANLNLNAGAGGTITFDDRITSTSINNVININSSVAPSLTTGTVIFNDLVSDSSINLYDGTLSLGADNNAITHTYMSNVNLTLSGGTLDMQNKYAGDIINLNNLTMPTNSTAKVTIDADFANNKYDSISVSGVATGTLTINNINFLSDATTVNSTMTVVTGGTLTDLILASTTINSTLYEYVFTQSATKGVYNVLRTSLSGINYAVKSATNPRTFDATDDTNAEYSLGTMGGSNSTLTINGNNHSINGLGYGGIINSGQTLEIKNVGSLNADGTVNKSWNGFTSTTAGGAISNYGTTNITNSVFYNNTSNDAGGVIYSYINTYITISDSTFINNSSVGNGGAIASLGYVTINSGSQFINNHAVSSSYGTSGGAIYIHPFGSLKIQGSASDKVNFFGNYAYAPGGYLSGGAIYNTSNNELNSISYADFEYNGYSNYSIVDKTASNILTTAGGAIGNEGKLSISDSVFKNNAAVEKGGAIYNTGNITIADSTFENNTASWANSGGAIYNSGTLNIQATANGETKFSGNKAAGVSNAIHLASGTLNLNAGADGKITFDDTITSDNRNNPININDRTVASSLTTGTIIFNNTVSDSSINLKSGTLTLGQDNNAITGTYMNNVNLTMSGGILDMENNVAGDVINLNNLTIPTDSTATLTIDANLATGINDTINVAGVATGILKLSHMKVTDSTENVLTMTLVKATGAGDISQLSLASFAAFTNLYKYDFTQKVGAYGVYDVVKTGAGGLNAAVASTEPTRVFTANLDESVIAPLGAMGGGTDASLTINGNNHNINGSGKAGMSVAEGQTLEINNVGSLNPDGSVATSWNGMSSTTDGGVVNNTGNLTITNSTFSNNSSSNQGGVLNNSYSGVLNISNSNFVGNYSASGLYGGGAINNYQGKLAINNGTKFISNGYNNAEGTIITYKGGAIYNLTSPTIESTIDNTIFKYNVAKESGGAIFNDGGKLTITNSEFTGNYANSFSGGAIYNYNGTLNISNTDFVQNYNNNLGGAIRTDKAMQISNGTTFIGNGKDALGQMKTYFGGAISYCASSKTIESTIDDTYFENNAAVAFGGAIYNDKGTLTISNTDFVRNYANYSGGAIYNNEEGTLKINSGSAFTGNGIITVDTIDYTRTTNGGAIYNAGTATIKDTTFENNKATTAGGAIYNSKGTLNIQASAGNKNDMKFSGNTANGVSNAIHLEAGTLNLNAGEGGVITFDDKITSANRDNQININYSGAESNLTTGTIIFNNTVSDASINLYDGFLTLGADHNSTTNTYLSNVNLTLLGGELDIRNQNTEDLIALNNLEISENSTATVSIDTDFANDKYDKISVSGTATGKLQLSNINLISDSDLENFLMQFIVLGTGASATGLHLEDYVAFTNDYEYDFTQSTTSGAYNVDKIERYPSSGLNGAIESGAKNRSYNALSDEKALYALGNMGGVNSTLNINANSHKIGGAGFGGVNVLSGQTLNINTAASWYGFVSENGGAINNSGTVTITDSVIENNKATGLGGAIYNAGTLNVLATAGNSTKFSGNTDSTGANAIYIANGGRLNINAGSGGTVTFNDSITSESSDNLININDSAINSTNTIGTVNFNNKINNAKVSVKAGNVNVSNTTVNNARFTMTGGTTTFSGTKFGSNSNIFLNGADAQTVLSGITQSGLNYSATDSFAKISAGTLGITNSTFSGYSTASQGGVINNAGTTTIVNSSFSNNSATSKGGAIYNAGTLNVVANGANTTFSNNKTAGALNDIYLASGSTLNINSGNGGAVAINSGIASENINNQININNTNSNYPTNGAVILNSAITNSTVKMYNGALLLSNDSYLNNNNLSMNGGILGLANNSIGTAKLNDLTLTGKSYFTMDADLAKGLSDRITATNASSINGGSLTLSGLNLLSDITSQANLSIADSNLSNYINLGITNISSPISNYNLSYNASSGNLSVTNAGFNPSILATPNSALVGTYLTQTNTYHEAFANIDAIMSVPRYDRLLMRYKNKSADVNGNFVFSPTMLPEEQQGYWVKEFTTFENVPLRNGPNVSNVAYGMLIGKDSEMKYLGKGFSGYTSAYVGYTGSRQNYDNVSSNQNGGLIGVTETVYKDDFFAALTVNMGGSNGNNYTSYGIDNYTTLMAGIAAKTGYNYETLGGKLIIQPSLTVSYTFADTFDYTTASGVNVTSDPLNAIQVIPGLKFIGNLKNGWQPYIATNLVCSFMDSTKFYANNVELPQTSVDPYIEYGFGLQRKWGDRFTGFGQAMARSGGRNGVALQFGFRWAIGK